VLLVGANSVESVRAALKSLGLAFAGPGLWLLLSAVFAVLFLKLDGKAMAATVGRTAKQWLPVAGAIVTFILAGQIVAASGAAELLAGGAAGALGVAYPAASPLVGALGGAMSGSNAGSNALFMPFQAEAATTSGSHGLTLAALQNVSGSQSNLLAPQRVVLAATATGLLGREAEIVRAIAPPVAVSVAILILVGAVYG
jgi:lactate permease